MEKMMSEVSALKIDMSIYMPSWRNEARKK